MALYIQTTATKKILALKKRIKAIQGGTSSSKTVSILLILIHKCQSDKLPSITSITSENLPHLRKGAIRDFQSIMKAHGYWKEEKWNKTESFYTFETGSVMEFFGADQSSKVHGPRRKRLFINEANNVPYEVFDQLEVRTEDEIFLDWNPLSEFWYQSEIDGKRDDVDFIILTYRDNEGLPENIRKSIEQRRNNRLWWRVYGEGQLGEAEGKIYKDWQFIDEVPHEARLISYGLDFGYTNDPTAIVAIYYLNGAYILVEIAYQKGLSNRQIADILLALPAAPVIADSAEPKSIDELRLYGITIMPSTKGKGSVTQGIQFVQAQRISVTKSSVNIAKEYRNYLWKTNISGKPDGNVPGEIFNHIMDATRYGFQIKYNIEPVKSYEQPAYEVPGL